ncbi:unnamed protein product [Dibothriocephalus latus]|uniref:C2H2-type domain-containing protein n=1 Tax=Dibothriocephalus latus TaxID=60516 RepID=A0A3P7L8U4_DIBLA|nr:unnamed protein product [Dibothriocephalus latus]
MAPLLPEFSDEGFLGFQKTNGAPELEEKHRSPPQLSSGFSVLSMCPPFHLEALHSQLTADRRAEEKAVPEGSCEEFFALVSAAAAAAKAKEDAQAMQADLTRAAAMPWLFPSALRSLSDMKDFQPFFSGLPSDIPPPSAKRETIDSTSPNRIPPVNENIRQKSAEEAVCLSQEARLCGERELPQRPVRTKRRRRRQVVPPSGAHAFSTRIQAYQSWGTLRGYVTKLLARIHGQCSTVRNTEIASKRKSMHATFDRRRRRKTTRRAARRSGAKRGMEGEGAKLTAGSRQPRQGEPWHNLCQTCGAWFNKRSQLEAHLYSAGHRRFSRPKSSSASSQEALQSRVYNLSIEKPDTAIRSPQGPSGTQLSSESSLPSLPEVTAPSSDSILSPSTATSVPLPDAERSYGQETSEPSFLRCQTGIWWPRCVFNGPPGADDSPLELRIHHFFGVLLLLQDHVIDAPEK